MINTLDKKLLDKDWIKMIEEAKAMGLTIEDVKIVLAELNKNKGQ